MKNFLCFILISGIISTTSSVFAGELDISCTGYTGNYKCTMNANSEDVYSAPGELGGFFLIGCEPWGNNNYRCGGDAQLTMITPNSTYVSWGPGNGNAWSQARLLDSQNINFYAQFPDSNSNDTYEVWGGVNLYCITQWVSSDGGISYICQNPQPSSCLSPVDWHQSIYNSNHFNCVGQSGNYQCKNGMNSVGSNILLMTSPSGQQLSCNSEYNRSITQPSKENCAGCLNALNTVFPGDGW